MPIKKTDYENDYELLYLISEDNESANEIIFKKYEPVIEYYVKKYVPLVNGKGIDYNDLYQEGLIGLASAIENYKDQKNIKFSTFAFMCIKRKIFSEIKKANRKKHSILNDSYSIDYQLDEINTNFESVIKTNEMGIEDLLVSKESEEFFVSRLNTDLTNFERQVYELRINGFNYDEIANMLGKTIKSVDSALFRIRQKIRKILDDIN